MTTWRAIIQETHIPASFSDLRGRGPGGTAHSGRFPGICHMWVRRRVQAMGDAGRCGGRPTRRGSGCRPVRSRPLLDAISAFRAEVLARFGCAWGRRRFLGAGLMSASCASSNYGGPMWLTCLQHAQGNADHPDGYDGAPTVRLPCSVEVGDHSSVIVRMIRRHAGEP
jgi:hypothetical protein